MGKNSNVMDLEQTNMGAFTEAIQIQPFITLSRPVHSSGCRSAVRVKGMHRLLKAVDTIGNYSK